MKRLALLAALVALVPGSTAAAAPSGSWAGTFTLPASAEPVAVAVVLHGRSATVSLGPGHASAATVEVDTGSGRVGFSFPGLPADVVFSGTLTGDRWSGTVSQGALRGSFALRRRPAPAVSALGLYRSSAGRTVAVVQAAGLPTWLVELPSGTTHGLDASLATVGTLLGETSGDGTLAVDSDGLTWTRAGSRTRYARVRLRQWEVRVGALAGTLTLPAGPGPFAAAVMVHGSETTGRDEFQVFAAYLESIGVGVLAADERGGGQSGGPADARGSSEAALNRLAGDAAALVDFLAARPSVDPGRVGLLGDSQAGWTIALAAARDRRVRWAVPLVGPTTSVGETDLFTRLAGAEQTPPTGPRADMIRQVQAAGRSGFDPLPSLRKLGIPVFWAFGDDDRNVPTELCLARLRSIRRGHRFSWTVLQMTHALIDLPTGLYSSLARSRGFNARLFPLVGAWLSARRIER